MEKSRKFFPHRGPLCRPYPIENPRVFFAGEHLSIDRASVQGAMQTAVAAVIEVLEGFAFSMDRCTL